MMATPVSSHGDPEIPRPERTGRDSTDPRRRRRPVVRAARIISAVAALAITLVGCAEAGASPQAPAAGAPTIVLVHGAFADASSWSGVVSRLQRDGYDVVAPANPLRGLTSDSAYIASYLKQLGGCTLLVGHSYGGAVMTNAANDASNVHGLVYVAGFAPDEGEVLGDVEKTSKDSVLNSALRPLTYPSDSGGGQPTTEYLIDPQQFHSVFAADLPADEAALLAATQRPAAQAAFSEASGPPAWKKLRSWAVVGTGDTAAGADVIGSMATRAGADITEINASHLVMVSHPDEVTTVIEGAATAVRPTC
jgi:pimeloyl-ACP methyl ester carboxylesterase